MDKTRHEAAGISGNVSALAFTRIPNKAAARAFSRQGNPRFSDGGPRFNDRNPKAKRPKRDRGTLKCEHPTCRTRVGHSTENCFVRKREAGEQMSSRRRNDKAESASPASARPRSGRGNESDSE
jgi:hypothetical protein